MCERKLVVLQHGVEDPCRKHHLRTNLSVPDLDRVVQSADVDIVGAPNEDDMHKTHACYEGNDTPGHDLVLAKQTFIADVATR